MKRTSLIAAAGTLLLAAGLLWWWLQREAVPDVTYRTAKIERGSLQATVSASGAVNPVTQVSVGTQVSGQIKELLVDFNTEVKAGQLIAQIDPETYEYRVRQAQADVDAARAAVLTAQASVSAAQAQVSRAQVDVNEAQRDLQRKADLVAKEFIAKSEADKARALVNTTGELLKSAQAQLGVTHAQVKSAQANVAQREAALSQARVDLSRTRILSPVHGIVIKRAVEKGQTVAASLQAPELFVIAQNLSDMQVDASIDEADVSRIRIGQRASFTVDAFPGQNFDGEVKQVRKAAQNVANVVTYIAVVTFSNTGGRLLPGMTANVRVVTDSRDHVLKVPNAALRVRLAGVEPAGAAASAPVPGASGVSTGQRMAQPAWLASLSLLSAAHAQPAPAGGGPSVGGGSGGGGLAAQRDRLVTELQLDDAQKAKLDAIGQDMRPRFMGLRDLGETERAVARDKIMSEMRGKISAMLTPEQRKKYQEMLAVAPARGSVSAATTNSGALHVDPMRAEGQKNLKNSPPNAPEVTVSSPRAMAAPAPSPSVAAPAATPPAAVAVAPGAAGGGPLGEMRNRLASELALSPQQLGQLDALLAESRPKFMGLRDLAADERGKARERIMADVRARINDMLTPEQKPKYAALQAEMAQGRSTRGRIHVLGEDNKPVAYNVRLGISDGTSTELIVSPGSPQADILKEGVAVITGSSAGASGSRASGTGASGGPRLPF